MVGTRVYQYDDSYIEPASESGIQPAPETSTAQQDDAPQTSAGPPDNIKCSQCSAGFKTKREVTRHINTVHAKAAGRQFTCDLPDCPAGVKKWSTKSKLESHNRQWHGDQAHSSQVSRDGDDTRGQAIGISPSFDTQSSFDPNSYGNAEVFDYSSPSPQATYPGASSYSSYYDHDTSSSHNNPFLPGPYQYPLEANPTSPLEAQLSSLNLGMQPYQIRTRDMRDTNGAEDFDPRMAP